MPTINQIRGMLLDIYSVVADTEQWRMPTMMKHCEADLAV